MPRVDPQTILDDWRAVTQGELLPKPKYIEIAERQLAEQRELDEQHWLDWTPDELAKLSEAFGQQRLEFEEDDRYANVNIEVARYLRDVVMPYFPLPRWEQWEQKLLNARLTGCLRYKRETGKLIRISNDKAGLPLLDPADARDEYMRLQRRYLPTLLDWRNNGKALHWVVLTVPNFARGELRKGMKEIFARYNRLIWGSGKFPEIAGSMEILEAPLSARGDWNVHLNVLFACDGYLCYEKLQRAWYWGIKAGRVKEEPRTGETFEDALRRSLLELIKYPVRAIPEKSDAKAKERRADRGSAGRRADAVRDAGLCGGADGHSGAGVDTAADVLAETTLGDRACAGRGPSEDGEPERLPAPALTQYPPGAFIEYVDAHRGLRRTRTHGVLYKIKKPEPESQDGFETVRKWHRRRGDPRTVWDPNPLLFLIQGDKSGPEDIRKRQIERFHKLLGPPDLLARVCDARRTIEKHFGPVSLATS